MRWFAVLLALLFCQVSPSQDNPTEAQSRPQSLAITGSVLRADTRGALKNVQIILVGPVAEEPAQQTDEDQEPTSRLGTTSDDKGNFTFENLKPGTYRLVVSHPGMMMRGGDRGTGLTVNLEAGHSQRISVLMLPTGVITGRIFNEQGEPMQGVSVAALRQLYSVRGRHLHPVQNAISDDKGEYRLFGLKPGTYLVRAGGMQSAFDIGSQTGPYGTNQGNTMIYVPLFFPSAATPEEATPVIVRPGDEAVADFSLARVSAHRVSGRVLGLAPITDAEEHFRYVVAAPEGASTLFTQARAEVKKDSSFQIPALPSGKYRLIVMDADDKGLVRYGTREVSVDSSDLEGVTLDIDGRKQQVNGVVRLEGQTRPDLSHLYVVLGAIGNDSSFDSETNVFASSSGFAQVKRDGSFETEVVPTSNRVCAMVGARGGGFEDWYTSKVLLNGKDVLEPGFRIADLQGRRLEVVISPHGGSVTGTALDAHKTPFAGAQIVALPSDPKLRDRYDLVQRTIADQQGRFKLRGVRPGSYIVMALEDEQQQPFTENGFLEKNADKIRTVKVDQSATQLELHTIPVESY